MRWYDITLKNELFPADQRANQERNPERWALADALFQTANKVQLPDEHIVWQQIPVGKQFTYDGQGVPDGYEDLPPPPPPTEEQLIRAALSAAGVSRKALNTAVFMSNMTPPDTSLLTTLEAAIATIATNFSKTTTEVLEVL